jgi:PD-(D/E)XK nuclease superfamily
MIAIGLVVGVAAALLVAWLRAAWRRRARSRFAKARAARALAGEAAAELLLEAAGYAITARQARRAWQLRLDDEPHDIELRCDLLAEADGRTYVAEVKTGAAAPRIETAATRRQLLEYQVAYGVDGVLLVDAEAGAVRRVDFPMATPPVELVEDVPPKTTQRATIAWIVLAAAAGFAAGRLL